MQFINDTKRAPIFKDEDLDQDEALLRKLYVSFTIHVHKTDMNGM